MAQYGTNEYWRERNRSVPNLLSASKALEMKKQNGLDYWRQGNPTARSYKTPWAWLRVWLRNEAPECLWCQYAKNADYCRIEDILKIYDRAQRSQARAEKLDEYYIKHEA